jgi:membrane protein YdbS with pleckstrin-like domain
MTAHQTDESPAETKKGGGVSRISSLAVLLFLPLALAVVRGLMGGDTLFLWGMTAGVAWTIVVMLAIFFIYRYREHEIEAGSSDV